ncbi:MAG TPA: PAS domain S-box protein, partial [Bacteroidales bacterium]
MNLKELNELNKKESFKDFRLKSPRQLLLALTLGGTIIVALWQFFDGMYGIHQSKVLFQLRGLTLAAMLLNLLVGLIRANDKAYKQHIIFGFYIGTLFCTLLALLTGAGQSPYWYGLFFVLIGWFILLPFSYTALTFNGLAFVAIFTGVIFTQHKDFIDAQVYFRIFSIYSGILMVGWIAAINRNKADAENFLSSIRIQEANEELQAAIEELRAEVESHHETTCKLQEKQQLLDSILENAPMVIWSIDLEGRFIYSQGKGLENIGVRAGDNIGKSVFDVYKGTEAEIFVRKVLDGTIEQDIVKVKNLLYDTRVSPLYNTNGLKYGYIGVAMDVTEQKMAEYNLKKFRLVLDQVPVAAYIIDNNMHFEYVNAEFAKQSGYTVEDLLHKHINETIYNGEIPASRKFIAEALLRGESWQGELYSRHKTGRMYWANTIASPYNDEAGNVDGYIVIQQDVTDQKQMELDLIESEALYRSLIENTLDSVVLTQDYKFIYVNDVFLNLMGYTHEELMNIEPTSIIAPEDKERVMEYHAKRINGEVKAQTYTATFVRKDGSRFIAEMNSSTVVIKGKNSSLVTLRDITEREKLQQALRESELQYRNVVEQAIDGITITQDRNLIFANKAFCDILEYSMDEVLGMPVMQAVSAEDMDDMNDMFRRIESGEKFTRYTRWNAIAKSGKKKSVELHVTVID